jgi:alpha-beta hydrolase superfamily lysophospholipase
MSISFENNHLVDLHGPERRVSRGALAVLACGALGTAACQPGAAAPRAAGPAVAPGDLAAGALVSSQPFAAPSTIAATARLLIHDTARTGGGTTRASSLLFVPRGEPPAGGWPVIAWAHGTTTLGNKACAPSLSPDLDGGLTADGFTSHYASLIGALVGAGYAVVAPDFEGLGEVATVPYPYYDATSLARSLIAAVRAARHADARLSNRWAVVGHSDGGHAALAVEAHAAEAPELALRGTVAYAPFLAIAAHVASLGELARRDPDHAAMYVIIRNEIAANLTVGLLASSPDAALDPILGADLQALLPGMRRKCILRAFADVSQAVAARAPGAFSGLRDGWAESPAMRAFLAANDQAATPGFSLRVPTLIVSGTEDVFVGEALVAAFASRLAAARAPVDYRRYDGADHSTIVEVATPEVLRFLASRLRAPAQDPPSPGR